MDANTNANWDALVKTNAALEANAIVQAYLQNKLQMHKMWVEEMLIQKKGIEEKLNIKVNEEEIKEGMLLLYAVNSLDGYEDAEQLMETLSNTGLLTNTKAIINEMEM